MKGHEQTYVDVVGRLADKVIGKVNIDDEAAERGIALEIEQSRIDFLGRHVDDVLSADDKESLSRAVGRSRKCC